MPFLPTTPIMPNLRRLSTTDADFDHRLDALLAFESAQNPEVDQIVADIITEVRAHGDAAVLDYTRRFDKVEATTFAELVLPAQQLADAYATLSPELQAALTAAADRVRRYHEKQKQGDWHYVEADGTMLGQKITALDRVGIYVPGGLAAYPSSVLMNAIPAHVAGVSEIIMVSPVRSGLQQQLVLAAAHIAGVTQMFTIGGAQAVAALAYGTESVPAVDKIVGPGNAFVAAAKRRVFGVVGIDMVAGPSEILIISDGKTNPDWVAMDLFSQAEHDEIAQAILLSPSAEHLDAVAAAVERLLPGMPRADIIRASLNNRGALVRVRDLDEACAIANRIAPEHLEVSVAEPELLLPKLRHAGAIFLGRYTSEALGDYCAGPNHVLPTSRTARFASPLGVYDFQKRSSLIQVSAEGARHLGAIASRLADGEGLPAHAQSARYRM